MMVWEFVFEVAPLTGVFEVMGCPMTDISLRASRGLGLVIGWEDLAVEGVFVAACGFSFMRDGWVEVVFLAVGDRALVDLVDFVDAVPGYAYVF